MHPSELEIIADRELRHLPLPPAPRTLLPRVLASVQEWTLRPWYSRAWFTWPVAWQAATIAALLLLSSAAVVLLANMPTAIPGTSSALATAASDVAGVARRFDVMVDVGAVLYHTLLAPILPLVSLFVVVMCLACALFGAALNHVVWERVLHR